MEKYYINYDVKKLLDMREKLLYDIEEFYINHNIILKDSVKKLDIIEEVIEIKLISED